ncbi:MAG: hypothetical protein M3132_05280 [Actinomycetia bacterium]|nr:hypothetical protein [Actinomycetes bacterium]
MTRAFAHRSTEMMIPRSLVVQHPMGHCLGAPFDIERHHEILDASFDLLETATTAGTIVEFGKRYRAGRS